MPSIVTSAYVAPGTACLSLCGNLRSAMAARASTPPIRCSGASALTWTDEGRDADRKLYSRQGRSGPAAAAFLIGPMSPSARGMSG
jgi:hypothetical protein